MKPWVPEEETGKRRKAEPATPPSPATSPASTPARPQPDADSAPVAAAPAQQPHSSLVTRPRREVPAPASTPQDGHTAPGGSVEGNGHTADAALAAPVVVPERPAERLTQQPVTPPAPVEDEELEVEPYTEPEEAPRKGNWLTNLWLWKARGFWLGGVGIALALFAQKLLTVDHQVVLSIRWYAVSIAVVLLAWLGTYKNRSSLVREVKRRRRAASVEVAPTATGSAAPVAPVQPSVPATTLPVRVRKAAPASVVEQPAPSPTPGWQVQLRGLRERYPTLVSSAWRYALAIVAFGLSLFSTGQLRGNYYSTVGSLGWVASLLLLVVAFVGERKRKVASIEGNVADAESRDRVSMSRWLEIGIVVGIVLLAFFMRVYRLDDWTGGMHGDEGETGMDAVSILEGNRVSPFLTGWFSHPNFSFWAVALTMQVFGVSLFGLRILSTILGALVILPFYGLVRMWFGVRAAIVASVLFAVMDVSLYFGKLGLNNIETPVFLVVGFYFLVRGLRTLRTLDFVLSGYGFMLTLYFYFAGRLTPFIVMAVFGYLLVLLPLTRVPGSYFSIRRRMPQLSRGRAWGRAFGEQARPLLGYIRPVIFFGIACICMAGPWLVFYLDHQDEMNSRSADKFIFTPQNQPRMAQQYGATHDPLYVGVRAPTQNDVYPWLPIVFEKTPVSVQVAADGFFARSVWGQFTTSLSIFTYRGDNSSFYTFTGEPAAKPLEVALMILGLAFALWRWRDSRMGIVSIWFWMTVIAGGVFTIDAPYMPRLVGLVPAMAILIAITVNKFLAELQSALGGFRARVRWQKIRYYGVRAVAATLAILLLVYSGVQNFNDYNRYLNTFPNRDSMGAAYFVRQMSDRIMADGRPQPEFYQLGMHVIYWGYGVNRFLNHGRPGDDMINPANLLPLTNNDGRDVVFFAWPFNSQYLDMFRAYYPGGEQSDFNYGPPGEGQTLFTYYRVTKQEIESHRGSMATYTPASGPAIKRQEGGLGTNSTPPDGLTYPAQVAWTGGLVAPDMGKFRLGIDTGGAGGLIVDGTQVMTTTAGTTHAEADVVLAKGVHDITLKGTLPNSTAKVALMWSNGGQGQVPVPREFLWNGPGHSLVGQITQLTSADPTAAPPPDQKIPLITERVDGFLGFRHTPDAIVQGPFEGTWTGTLDIKQAGMYGFDVYSNGASAIFVDDQLVTRNNANGDPQQAAGQVSLDPGPHKYQLRYVWQGGTGYLEAYWTPPGGNRTLIGPNVLHADGGIVDAAALSTEPAPVQVQPQGNNTPNATLIQPDAIIGQDAGLSKPRGVAVDKAGNMYVGDRGNHRVVVFSPDGKVLRSFGKAAPGDANQQPGPGEFGDIDDVAVAQDGTVYVLDGIKRAQDVVNRLQAFSSNGDFLGVYDSSWLGLYGPNGIATGTSSDGKGDSVYIAVTGQNRILKLPSIQTLLPTLGNLKAGDNPLKGLTEDVVGTPDNKFEQPVDVVADPTDPNTLYVIDLKDRIAQVQRSSAGAWTISKSWKAQAGRDDGGSRLGISPDGKLVYMADPDRKRVAVLDVNSGEVTYFGAQGTDPGRFNSPLGLAVAADGRIYVLDRDNANVQVFATGKKP